MLSTHLNESFRVNICYINRHLKSLVIAGSKNMLWKHISHQPRIACKILQEIYCNKSVEYYTITVLKAGSNTYSHLYVDVLFS